MNAVRDLATDLIAIPDGPNIELYSSGLLLQGGAQHFEAVLMRLIREPGAIDEAVSLMQQIGEAMSKGEYQDFIFHSVDVMRNAISSGAGRRIDLSTYNLSVLAAPYVIDRAPTFAAAQDLSFRLAQDQGKPSKEFVSAQVIVMPELSRDQDILIQHAYHHGSTPASVQLDL